ncbi:MAG: hypothetical protein WA988_07580 [Candidatus Nanopelagicales bacterium]
MDGESFSLDELTRAAECAIQDILTGDDLRARHIHTTNIAKAMEDAVAYATDNGAIREIADTDPTRWEPINPFNIAAATAVALARNFEPSNSTARRGQVGRQPSAPLFIDPVPPNDPDRTALVTEDPLVDNLLLRGLEFTFVQACALELALEVASKCSDQPVDVLDPGKRGADAAAFRKELLRSCAVNKHGMHLLPSAPASVNRLEKILQHYRSGYDGLQPLPDPPEQKPKWKYIASAVAVGAVVFLAGYALAAHITGSTATAAAITPLPRPEVLNNPFKGLPNLNTGVAVVAIRDGTPDPTLQSVTGHIPDGHFAASADGDNGDGDRFEVQIRVSALDPARGGRDANAQLTLYPGAGFKITPLSTTMAFNDGSLHSVEESLVGSVPVKVPVTDSPEVIYRFQLEVDPTAGWHCGYNVRIVEVFLENAVDPLHPGPLTDTVLPIWVLKNCG